ncbi:MAG: HAMP domain-containing sensor histidine kinase [Pseudomonadota bacterium]
MNAAPLWFSRAVERGSVRGIHLLWLIGVLAAAMEWGLFRSGQVGAIAGWVMAAAPGVTGLVLGRTRLERSDLARFTLVISWTLPAFAASAAFGGALSIAALVFLAGPAASAAIGRRGDVTLAGLVAIVSFAALATFSLLAAPAPAAIDPGATSVIAVLLAAFFASAALFSGLRAMAARDDLDAETRRLRPAADAFEHAPEALIACDEGGRVLVASNAVSRIAPGAPRKLDGLPVSGLGFSPEDESQVEAELSRLSARHADLRGFSFHIRSARGAAQPVMVEANLAPDALVLKLAPETASNSGGALERLKAERDEAVAASQAKSEFLASVSHELRTPLNAIIGFSDVMKQRLFGPMPARYAEYADMIHESGHHLLDLIGDVLDMSKIEADRYELSLDRFDVRDIMDTCTQMVRMRAEDKGLVLSADGGDEAIEVEADRKALRQILLNLLSNAVKFTPEGGAVAVMARASGGELVLAVGDSGVGIDEGELARLGERYQQSDSARESGERGTGLGLSLVKALAEMHGGSMSIQSARGEGTTVTVRMPVIASASVEVVGDEDADLALDVREQIALAQSVGESLASSKAAS